MINLATVLEDSNISAEIRRELHHGEWVYSSIDLVALFLKTDRTRARNYYHVLKNRFKAQDYTPIAKVYTIKTVAADAKVRFTDFISFNDALALQKYLEHSFELRSRRVEQNKDEVANFHPQVMTFLKAQGWFVRHHVSLLSGRIIDIVARKDEVVNVIECKPNLSKGHLYSAIGQVLCYTAEYTLEAKPVIATLQARVNQYALQSCEKLGIQIIGIP